MNQQTLSQKTIGLALAVVILVGCASQVQDKEVAATILPPTEASKVPPTPTPTSQPTVTPIPPTRTSTPLPSSPTPTAQSVSTPTPMPFSPAGAIAFHMQAEGNLNRSIYVINADGSHMSRITHDSANNMFVSWSPDGEQLVYCSLLRSDAPEYSMELFTVNVDGSNLEQITDHPTFDQKTLPDWSPDGEQMAFASSRDGNDELYLLNLATGEETRLTQDPAHDTFPRWSPDGSQIAFASDRHGNLDIFVMDADGSNQTRLTDNPAGATAPAWSPDGTKIAFHSERDGNFDIFVMDADGNDVERLTTDPSPDMIPTWSPDGQYIAFVSTRGEDDTFNLYVIDSAGNDLARLTSLDRDVDFPMWSPSPSTQVTTEYHSRSKVVCETENDQARQLYNEAYGLEEKGELEEAEQLYMDAIELDPSYCDAMDNLGAMLRQQGRIAEAIDWYKRSIEILPSNYVAHQNLAVAYRFQGRMTEAIAEYQLLVELDPDNPEGYFGLGQTYYFQDQFHKAVIQLEKAEELYQEQLSPWVVDARSLLGVSYYLLDKCEEAKEYVELVYAAIPDSPENNYLLGLCYLCPEIEDLELAEKYLTNAAELGVDIPPEVWEQLEGAIPTPALQPAETPTPETESTDEDTGEWPQLLGTPVSEWYDIPVMPGAIAGDEADSMYVYTMDIAPAQVQGYYEQEMIQLDWELAAVGEMEDADYAPILFFG